MKTEELQNDRESLLEAIKEDKVGFALGFASEELQNDPEFVLAVLKNNCLALKDASKELKNNREFLLEAVAQNAYVLIYTDIFANHFQNADFVEKVHVSINTYLNSLIQDRNLSDEEYEKVKATIQKAIWDIEERVSYTKLKIKEPEPGTMKKIFEKNR